MGDNEICEEKNEGELLAISIAKAMQRYDAGRIAQYSMSRASLEANWCRYWASACAIMSRWPPLKQKQNTNKTQLLASNYSTFWALVFSKNFIPQNKPSTHLIDASSFI